MSLPQHRQEGLVCSQSSLSNTHTFKHTLWRRSCPFVMSFLFSNLLHEKVYSALDSHLADGRSVQKRTIIAEGKYYCRPDLRWKCSHWVFLWFPEKYNPPWEIIILIKVHGSSMATLSKHTRRRSSHFHNNQHGTFRPEYIINKCTKWTHCWQVDGYCPVLFLDSYAVLSGACKYLAYNVMLVFVCIYNSFFCHVRLGI